MTESGGHDSFFGRARYSRGETLAIPLKRAAPSHQSSPLRLVEVMAVLTAAGPVAAASFDSLRSQIQQGKNLAEAFATLDPQEQKKIREKIGEKPLEEILAMSGEPDERMFFHNLLHFGIRLKMDSDYERAVAILGVLSQGAAFPVPSEIRDRAEKEFNAIVGKGAVGRRLEVLLDRFSDEATDLKTLGPMVGASCLGHLVGTGVLGSLLSGSSEAWYSRSLGARLTAGFAGYTAEFSSFALANRALAAHPEGSLGDDLWRSAIAIGSLKATSFLGNQVFLKLHGFNKFGIPTRLSRLAQFDQVAIPQFSMFAGMMGSHLMEERMGLRPHTDDATLVTDTLSSMLSLGIGGDIGRRALGPGFARFQTELALRAESYRQLADRVVPEIPHDSGMNLHSGILGAMGVGLGVFLSPDLAHAQILGSEPASDWTVFIPALVGLSSAVLGMVSTRKKIHNGGPYRARISKRSPELLKEEVLDASKSIQERLEAIVAYQARLIEMPSRAPEISEGVLTLLDLAARSNLAVADLGASRWNSSSRLGEGAIDAVRQLLGEGVLGEQDRKKCQTFLDQWEALALKKESQRHRIELIAWNVPRSGPIAFLSAILFHSIPFAFAGAAFFILPVVYRMIRPLDHSLKEKHEQRTEKIREFFNEMKSSVKKNDEPPNLLSEGAGPKKIDKDRDLGSSRLRIDEGIDADKKTEREVFDKLELAEAEVEELVEESGAKSISQREAAYRDNQTQ